MTIKHTHSSHIKRMLHNHGWQKQQLNLKGVRQAKKPTKRNPAVGQQDHSNVYGRKKTIIKIKLQK